MKEYEVTITILRESSFTDTIEAESEVDAEDVAQQRYWDDEYSRELRSSGETVDETYYAEEITEDYHIYDKDDNWLITMYDQPDEETALDEYNESLTDDEVVGDYAERC